MPGPRYALVLPHECSLDPAQLQPSRTTHLHEGPHAHPVVLHDRWDLPHSQSRQHPWFGRVVFHALDGTEFSLGGVSKHCAVSVLPSTTSSSHSRSTTTTPKPKTSSSTSFPSSSSKSGTLCKTNINKVVTFDISDDKANAEVEAEKSEFEHFAGQHARQGAESQREAANQLSGQHQLIGHASSSLCPRRAQHANGVLHAVPYMLKQFLSYLGACAALNHGFERPSSCIAAGTRGELQEGTSSLQQGASMETNGPKPVHDLAGSAPRNGPGIHQEEELLCGGRIACPHDGQELLTGSEGLPRDQIENGNRQAADQVQSTEELELPDGRLHPSGRVSSTPSRERTVLVHLPAVRESMGETGASSTDPIVPQNQGSSQVGYPKEIPAPRSKPELPARAVQSTPKAAPRQSFQAKTEGPAPATPRIDLGGNRAVPSESEGIPGSTIRADPLRPGFGQRCADGSAKLEAGSNVRKVEVLSGAQLEERGFCMPQGTRPDSMGNVHCMSLCERCILHWCTTSDNPLVVRKAVPLSFGESGDLPEFSEPLPLASVPGL